MITFRRSYQWKECLAIEIDVDDSHFPSYSVCTIFSEDPLPTNFLEGNVPVGILLDYIEDNLYRPDFIRASYYTNREYLLIRILREYFTDPTLLVQKH